MATSWADRLLSVDENAQAKAWEDIFLNPTATREFLRQTSAEVVLQVVQTGQAWQGNGWDTTKCARVVRSLTGCCMVAARVQDYLHAYLFSLVLVSGITLPSLELKPIESEVAFKLADCWEQVEQLAARARVPDKNPAGTAPAEEEGEEHPQDMHFLWDSPPEPLPEDLAAILARAGHGERLDLKSLLDAVPLWQGLKARSEENNYRNDKQAPHDKFLRSMQQRVLNVIRIFTMLHTILAQADAEVCSVSQQLFLYLLNIEEDILKERKRRSIPSSVVQTENVLFGQEDLKQDALVNKVNRAGFNGVLKTLVDRKWYFPTNTGPRTWKFKKFGGGKGFGGKGFSSSFKGKGKGRPTWSSRCGSVHFGHGAFSKLYGRVSTTSRFRCLSKPEGASFGGENPSKRAKIGKYSVVRKTPFEDQMVGEKCTLGGIAPRDQWGGPKLGQGTGAPMAGTMHQSPTSGGGRAYFAGILDSGGSATRGIGGDPIFGAMVCDRPEGGRKGEASIDIGLQGHQSVPHPEKVSVGQFASNPPVPTEGPMGRKIGFERRILSLGFAPRFAKAFAHESGLTSVGVSGGGLWPEHHALPFHEVDGSFRKTLENQGNLGFCLFGRHSSFGSVPGAGGEPFGIFGRRSFGGWVENQCGKKRFQTNARGYAFGFSAQFKGRETSNLPGQVENGEKGA